MASSRADCERSGGHASVADKVVEDWFLAHRYEEAGLPVSAWMGAGQIANRLYPGGMREMVVGFEKNFATTAASPDLPALPFHTPTVTGQPPLGCGNRRASGGRHRAPANP